MHCYFFGLRSGLGLLFASKTAKLKLLEIKLWTSKILDANAE